MNKIIDKFIDELKNTGERPILRAKIEDIDPVLQFAYKFASKKVKDSDTILDYGCGGGYGIEYLSRFTKNSAIGYDIDSSTISTNKSFFKDISNLRFTCDESNLGHYDIIVLFQVIEHLSLSEHVKMITSLKQLLNDGGVLILATVNKNITSFKLDKPVMPFHVYEYYPDALTTFLNNYFKSVECYGQIEVDLLREVRKGERLFEKRCCASLKQKIIRRISQWEFVRIVARHTPLFLKSLAFGYKKNKSIQAKYRLTENEVEAANSYILICKCSNEKSRVQVVS